MFHFSKTLKKYSPYRVDYDCQVVTGKRPALRVGPADNVYDKQNYSRNFFLHTHLFRIVILDTKYNQLWFTTKKWRANDTI